MKISKRLNKTLILLLLVALCYAFVFSFGASSLIAQAGNIDNASIQKYQAYENQQSYINDNGDNRTIYWTKGITAPKMPSKGDGNLGKDGYFSLEQDPEYVTYSAPIKQNQGYYDLNKNPYRMSVDEEAEFCYMATAINGIYWWLDQNLSYVESLKNYVMNGSIVQEEGLRNIKTDLTWNTLNKRPSLIEVDGKKRQEIGELKTILNTFMNQFYQLKTGYFSDRVWDFFFNGYKALPDTLGGNNYVDQNNESNFVKDKEGGIFNSIFGTKRLSKRIVSHSYLEYNKLIDYIVGNQFVGISYYTNGEKTRAHSITLWGAEYDDNYNLTRVYITDSDDYDQTYVANKTDDVLRGIRSYDVGYDENGDAYISNNGGKNKSYLYLYQTLDLGTEMFQQKLSQVSLPIAANIEKQPIDFNYGSLSATVEPIQVVASTLDGGKLSYQWYSATTLDGEGTLISGAKSSSYKPKLDYGTYYYYCVIKNTKFGHEIDIKSRVSKVVVDASFTDAKLPTIISFNDNVVEDVTQYSNPEPMKILAESPDGGFITYQWYKKEGSIADYKPSGGTPIPGATNNYLIPDTTGDVYVSYYCVVTNNNPNVSGAVAQSKATSKAKRYKIIPNEKQELAATPTIVEHPKDATYVIHDNAIELSVIAGTSDGGKITYQWYQALNNTSKGKEILGATKSTYKPSTFSVSDYYYYCEITNTNANATSQTISTINSNRAHVVVTNGNLSSNTNIKSIVIKGYGGKEYTPSYDATKSEYTLNLTYEATSSITIIVTAEDVNAEVFIKKDGRPIDGEQNIEEGTTKYQIVVVAEDNSTKKAYDLIINRAHPFNRLKSLEVVGHELHFSPNSYSYGISVKNHITEVDILAEAEYSTSTVTGTGKKQLKVGGNEFKIVCTDSKGNKQTYSINIFREDGIERSGNANLKFIKVKGYDLDPLFDKAILSYTLNVPSDVQDVDITYEAEDSKATVEFMNNHLSYGENIFTIKVTAENGNEKKYVLKVIREDPNKPSDNNYLKTFWVIDYEISPKFNKTILSYTLRVPNKVTSVGIGYEQEDENAYVSSTLVDELVVGENIFKIIVTAQNGDIREYILTVIREEQSSRTTISELKVNGQSLGDIFRIKDTHDITVPYEVDRLDIEALLPEDENSSVEIVNFDNLLPGKINTVLIKVKAENGTVKEYTLNVYRKGTPEEDGLNIKAIIGISVTIVVIVFGSIVLIVGFAIRKRNQK